VPGPGEALRVGSSLSGGREQATAGCASPGWEGAAMGQEGLLNGAGPAGWSALPPAADLESNAKGCMF
jgi:hypothetical protein